jgi:UDP-N-acetylmuramoyl-L-alanyl-D-glutamate--2,6-diaminopimelate ligase
MNAVPGATEIGARAKAIQHSVSILGEGDCLVIAGKGHEEGQIVGTKTLPFSDHKVLARALTDNGGEVPG